MPRFFFDIDDGSVHPDRIGRELEGVDDARREAAQVAAKLVAEELSDGDGLTLELSVRCEDGTVALRVRMACQVDLV